MNSIKKLVILGSSGYIGKNISQQMSNYYPWAEIINCSPPEYDLLDISSTKKINKLISEGTIFVVCSGLKKQRGDNLNNYINNVLMIANLINYVDFRKIRYFIFFSSAEVYGENLNDLSINEKTPTCPTSYYGIAKLTSEQILKKHFNELTNVKLMILRPALVYGPNEDEAFYGPSGFIKKVLNQEVIEIWGDGSELREFVFIDDLVKILKKLIDNDFSGIINIVNGKSFSFAEILENIKLKSKNVVIRSKPRSREKVDQGYDNSMLKSLFPEFKFTDLSKVISLIYKKEKNK